MARSWTIRLAVTIAASQLLLSVFAQSATPTVSEQSSVASAPPSSTDTSGPTVHMIKAGAGGFKFTPPELYNVSVGDIVKWEFYPLDHSVARADFGSACVPYEYTGKDKVGFWSGTQYVNNTNEVCLSHTTDEDTQGFTDVKVAHVLQYHRQRHSTDILLLCGTKLMYGRTHGWRYQSEQHRNS
jgi:plastocyanin